MQRQSPQDPREAMAEVIQKHVEGSVDWQTPIAGLSFFRRNEWQEPKICLIEPSAVVVVQGAKQLVVGGNAYRYDRDRFLVTTLDVPANSGVLEASADKPCLGFWLELDLRLLAELIAQGQLPPNDRRTGEKTIGVADCSPVMLESFARLLALVNEPEAIEVLAPLIKKEIHYRLLTSAQAPLLRQIASVNSHGYRIAKAIDWLKLNYRSGLKVDSLAERVQMSTPNFHHHFRELTAMSPLQYQKWLRLNEAKRLMINEHMDAASASYFVGYESPSQFSREYKRLFGAPPKKDIEALRLEAKGG